MFIIILTLIVLGLGVLYVRNRWFQTQHSILRQYPIMGMFRYLFEMLGPEMRQYITDSDTEGRPFSRYIYRQVVKLGKYGDNIIGFGSQRDFDKPGFYLLNKIICVSEKKLLVDNTVPFSTYTYKIKKETLISRHEDRVLTEIKPWLLNHQCRYNQQGQQAWAFSDWHHFQGCCPLGCPY